MTILFEHRPNFAFLNKEDVKTIKAWVKIKTEDSVPLDDGQELIVRMAQEIHFLQEQLRG